jgi:hypothetical protein
MMAGNWVEVIMLTAAISGLVLSVAAMVAGWWLFGRSGDGQDRSASDVAAE